MVNRFDDGWSYLSGLCGVGRKSENENGEVANVV